MGKNVWCVLGTRPEVIKMAPVIMTLHRSRRLHPVVVATAQHRELLDDALAVFGLRADIDLDLMRPDQTQEAVLARLLMKLMPLLRRRRPAAVLAQGDTATVFAAALAAYLAQVPFGHVEAGLRTGDLAAPFPEEGYRHMLAAVTRWHFAPARTAAANLRRENIPARLIYRTGNPVIDALRWTLAQTTPPAWVLALPPRPRVLVTMHRRESFGAPLARIFAALRELACRYPAVEWLYPVHPNPQVCRPARQLLGGCGNVRLLPPVPYSTLAHLMARCGLVLTDSGGLQEEAPALGIPVVVAREKSEREDAVRAGTVLVAGTRTAALVRVVRRLLDDPEAYRAVARRRNPYGSGDAAEKIVRILERTLK